MAFEILVEVNTGYYFGFIIALGKYNAQVLLFGGITFEGVGGTGAARCLAFAVIDFTVLKNVLHFSLGYMPAIHTAFGMLGVFEIAHPPIKSIVAIGIIGFCMVPVRIVIIDRSSPATLKGYRHDNHRGQQQEGKSFFHVELHSDRNCGS
jgi:hypothetical protein